MDKEDKLTNKQLVIKQTLDFKEKEIKTEYYKVSKKPSCQVIVIDNFIEDPIAYRKMALSLDFIYNGNGDVLENNTSARGTLNNYIKKYADGFFPGMRTYSQATEELKVRIEKYVEPYGGKIINFFIPKNKVIPIDGTKSDNGAFQFTTSVDRSFIHSDHPNYNWAGVLYLTPNAPENSGTNFYKFIDGSTCVNDSETINSKYESMPNEYRYDNTKWKIIDKIGNKFNRLVLFNPQNYHKSGEYFGKDKYDGRLFQVFFFTTEY